MGLEYVVAGRLPLPKEGRPWAFELEHDPDEDDEDLDDEAYGLEEGSLEIYELEPADTDFFADVERVVSFRPASVLVIRPAGWDMSRIASEVLARALEGVTYFYTYESDEPYVELDAKGSAEPAQSLAELAERIRAAHEGAASYLERWEADEAASFQERLANDPQLARDNDWSDVSDDER